MEWKDQQQISLTVQWEEINQKKRNSKDTETSPSNTNKIGPFKTMKENSTNKSENVQEQCTWNGPQRLGKNIKRTGYQRKNWDHPDHSVKISKNTQKCPGDLRRLAVTLTPVKYHNLTLVWKLHKELNDKSIIL